MNKKNNSIIIGIIFFLNVFFVKAQTNRSTIDFLKVYSTIHKDHSFFIFPEVRENPIQWFDSIPNEKTIDLKDLKSFKLKAQSGEFFTFQIGLLALNNNVKNVKVLFSSFIGKDKQIITVSKMTCFNTEGVDIKGKSFKKQISVPSGRVQALWMGIDLTGVKEGSYKGEVTLSSGKETQKMPFELIVSGKVDNHGYNEGKRLARLNWLNSTLGIDDSVTKGFKPMELKGNLISILGRTLAIGNTGLPSDIQTFFTGSNEALSSTSKPIIDAPFRFVAEKTDGSIIQLKPGNLKIVSQSTAKIDWQVLNTSAELDVLCSGTMEFDGSLEYRLKTIAKTNVALKDIRLEISMNKEKSEYMMGLNHEGGLRTPNWDWKWDVKKNQDMIWLGGVNGGLRIKWKAENYKRPLVNIYYEFGPLQMPDSWENNGKGGVQINDKGTSTLINAYSGNRNLKKGAVLNYDFELLITPFKLIDKKIRYEDRYYQGGGRNSYVKIDDAKKAGANIITIHQADDIYPFINYPYLDENSQDLTNLVADAHKNDMRMKVYYTTRELTKQLPEFWAFNSLNGEVIFPGPGNAARTEALHPKGPHTWLIKNVREKYIPAWYDPIKEGKFKGEIDLSVITTPDSRLNNFYIAGLDWMVQNMKIDGIYIDDSALDRFTLLRARKVIDKYRPNGSMDLHSWNHFNAWAGYTNCLNLYMDLLPFFDYTWIGEGRDYNRAPDHWLIEISGIPFGITGQMLEGGGNPWRGMVYGITTRPGWTINPPTEIWKFWDEYQIKNKTMSGYWESDSPIQSNNPQVKATIYKGNDSSIIALANWTANDTDAKITLDWDKLGMKPEETEISIPEIKEYQNGQNDISLDQVKVLASKGFLIVLKKK